MIFLLMFPPVLTRVQGIWWKHSSLLFPPKQSRIQVWKNMKIWIQCDNVCQKDNETKCIWQVQILWQRHEQLSQARPNSSPKAAHKHGRNSNIQYMQPTKQLLRGHSGFVQTRFGPRICELKSGCAAEQSRNDDCVDHPDVNDVVTYLFKKYKWCLEAKAKPRWNLKWSCQFKLVHKAIVHYIHDLVQCFGNFMQITSTIRKPTSTNATIPGLNLGVAANQSKLLQPQTAAAQSKSQCRCLHEWNRWWIDVDKGWCISRSAC